MSEEALQACVDRHLDHAAFVFKLDDELGTHHGLSWADFVLLTVLDAAGGAAPATELARTLRTAASLSARAGPDCSMPASMALSRANQSSSPMTWAL